MTRLREKFKNDDLIFRCGIPEIHTIKNLCLTFLVMGIAAWMILRKGGVHYYSFGDMTPMEMALPWTLPFGVYAFVFLIRRLINSDRQVVCSASGIKWKKYILFGSISAELISEVVIKHLKNKDCVVEIRKKDGTIEYVNHKRIYMIFSRQTGAADPFPVRYVEES